MYSIRIFCSHCELCCRPCKKMYLRWRNLTWQNINCVITRFTIKVMGCHQHLSHQHYLPNPLQSNIVGELGVLGVELSAMIYISAYPLFCCPSIGYVKIPFEFLIQHSSSTESNNKTKNLFTRWADYMEIFYPSWNSISAKP